MRSFNKMQFAFVVIISLLINIHAQEDVPDPAMLYVYAFQEAMEGMFPTQTFTFDLNPGEQQKISLWPQADVEKVIVAFYTHNEENPEVVTGQGFFADCELNGGKVMFFENQKLGACTFDITSRPSFINLNFRSQEATLGVYVAYELKKLKVKTILNELVGQDVPTELYDKRNKLSDISQKFQKVQKRSQLQQGALRLITKSLNKHNTRFSRNLQFAQHRLITQTVLVIVSGLIGLWIIKKQLNSGYELLV